MSRNRWLVLAALLALSSMIAGANIGQFNTLNFVQNLGAERRALDEASHVLVMVPEIERLLRTGTPDLAQAKAMKAITGHSNVSAVLLFDRSGHKLLSQVAADWITDPNLVAAQNRFVETALSTGKAQALAAHTNASQTLPLLYSSAFVPFTDESGRTIGVVGIYLDLSEMANLFASEFGKLSTLLSIVFAIALVGLFAAYLLSHRRAGRFGRQADYLARYDQLTGVYNRGGFYTCLKNMRAEGRISAAHTAVFYFDLDNFKSTNDMRGHRAGDDILRHVGSAIREGLGPNDLVGRFGGDEFVVIAQIGTLDDAINFGEQIRERIAQPAHSSGVALMTRASFGIHFGIGPEASIEEEIHRADLALYDAKMQGRNTFRVFTPELEDRVSRRIKVESAVNRGLEDGLFSLQYQPLILRATGACVGFEALLRLRDVDGESMAPMEFVPIAEASGAIRKIGNWVLATAIAEAAKWPEELFVSVNLSARQFDDEDLVATIRSTIEDCGFDPRRLELEVTESLLIANSESVGRQLMELRALGISIAMDDFGTGYSSLGYLWKYGFDKLKIDRSFILGLSTDVDRVKEILDTIIVLGHRLNMKVTAEGIETEMQASLLSDLSCDQLQGFLYGRPMVPTDLPGFMLKNRMGAQIAADASLPQPRASTSG